LLLQAVLANGGGRVNGFFHVALLQDLPRAVGMMGPELREAVGLQLQLD
jgi:hypothetical protein